MVSSLPSKSRRVLETIRSEVSSSLKASLLVSELAATRDLLKNDLDQAHEQHVSLSEIAHIDELTGVMNRRGFMDKAGALFQRCQDAGLPVAVFFADVDYLKEINDHLGHADGDAAIRETAEVLKKGFRTGDIVGRMGGTSLRCWQRRPTSSRLKRCASDCMRRSQRLRARTSTASGSVVVSAMLYGNPVMQRHCSIF